MHGCRAPGNGVILTHEACLVMSITRRITVSPYIPERFFVIRCMWGNILYECQCNRIRACRAPGYSHGTSRYPSYGVILTNVIHNHPGHFDLRHSLTFALIHIVEMARIGIQENAYRLGGPSGYDPKSVCQRTCSLIKSSVSVK